MRVLLPLCSILLAAPLVEASPRPLDRLGAEAFTGTVVAADDLSVTARAENGTLLTFALVDPASMPAGLVAGDRVTVRYEHTEEGGLRVVGDGIVSHPTVSTGLPLEGLKRQTSDPARRPSSLKAAASKSNVSPPRRTQAPRREVTPPRREVTREAPATTGPAARPSAAASPVPESPSPREEEAEPTTPGEVGAPPLEVLDPSAGEADMSVFDPDSSEVASLVPLGRRKQLLAAFLLVVVGFLLVFVSQRI
jgi:hypothetical protein